MPLTNTQYDQIMRSYDERRRLNQSIQDQRYSEVLSLCPEIADIDNEIISLSMSEISNRLSTSPETSNDYRDSINKLKSRRIDLLASLGKGADYLDPVYKCGICHDTGYKADRSRCTCFLKKATDLVYSSSNLKNITKSENFKSLSLQWYDNTVPDKLTGLTPYNNMQRIVNICQNFVNNFDKVHSNLIFMGDTGRGKTFLTNCIAKELMDTAHSVIYLTASELFEVFEQHDFDNSSSSIDYSLLLACDLLIIDDLGTELSNSYTNSKLFATINERMLREKSSIISTNLSLTEIRDKYSERISSRLIGAYQFLKLTGNDIRVMKHNKKQ